MYKENRRLPSMGKLNQVMCMLSQLMLLDSLQWYMLSLCLLTSKAKLPQVQQQQQQLQQRLQVKVQTMRTQNTESWE